MKYGFALSLAVIMALGQTFAVANELVKSEIPIPDIQKAEMTFPIWQPLEISEINFEVFRKGKRFGEHRLRFEPVGEDKLKVKNEIALTARFGPIVAYKYRHASTELWEDGQLVKLESETYKNGNDYQLIAELGQAGLNVQGTGYQGQVSGAIIPSSHWNISQIFSDTILSSEDGKLLPIETTNLGRETLTIEGVDVQATKFQMSSDLTVFLWYDDEGRWLKCAFTARGQNIEYQLTSLY